MSGLVLEFYPLGRARVRFVFTGAPYVKIPPYCGSAYGYDVSICKVKNKKEKQIEIVKYVNLDKTQITLLLKTALQY